MPLPSTDNSTGSVTFLFTDIEGVLQLWQERPEALAPALAACDERVRACIEAHQGCIFQNVYNSFRAAFPTAGLALEAALSAQLAVTGLVLTETLSVRIALHTGSADWLGGSYFGPSLSQTIQLLTAGHGRQVLVSSAAQALVRGTLPPQAALQEIGRLDTPARLGPVFQLLHPALPADFSPLQPLGPPAFTDDFSLPSFAYLNEGPARRASSLYHRSRQARDSGDYAQAREWQQESSLLVQQLGDLRAVSAGLTNLGSIEWEQENCAAALPFYAQSLTLTRQWGDAREIANAVSNLANTSFYGGESDAAWPLYIEALALYRRLEDPREAASMLTSLGHIAAEREDSAAAMALREEAVDAYRQHGDPVLLGGGLSNLGRIAFEEGDYAGARAAYEECLALWRQQGDEDNVASTLSGLATVATYQEEYAAARAYYAQCLTICRQRGDEDNAAAILERLASLEPA